MRAILVAFLLWCNALWAQKADVAGSRPYDLAFKLEANSATADINVEYTTAGVPKAYSSYLETDVCSDGLCKPVSITIKWDLLGKFLSYHTDENHPLTKFDHVKLTEKDHKQLHKILSDTASIIRDYQVEDMIDTNVRVKSLIEVDAVTGATSKAFEGTTVEGALYTVYTLWHFTNGAVRKKILEYTRSHLSDALIRYMLHSENRDYISFIFKNLTPSQKNKLIPDIINLVPKKDMYIPHFAIAQLTADILADTSIQHALLNYLPAVNVHVKNALLERFNELNLDSRSLSLLIASIPKFNEQQLIKAFSIIENNRQSIDTNILMQLRTLSEFPDEKIARATIGFLNRIK